MWKLMKRTIAALECAFEGLCLPKKLCIPVTIHRQLDGYSCAYLCACAALDWCGAKYDRDELWRELKMHKREGVTFKDVAAALRQRGVAARYRPSTPRHATIVKCIESRRLILGSLVLPSKVSHSVIVNGFTDDGVLIKDPLSPRLQVITMTALESEYVVVG